MSIFDALVHENLNDTYDMCQHCIFLSLSFLTFFQGKKRWVHRFTEHFEPASLTCISAGQSLVALGTKTGKIHVYESSSEFKCLRWEKSADDGGE